MKLIAKSIYFVGAKIRNPSLFKIYNSLKYSEKATLSELNELQLKNIKEFFLFTQEYSPYYKKLFKEINFDPSKIESAKDIKIIPITTKKDLVEKNEEIHSTYTFNRIFHAETSGSTGKSLKFNKNEEWDSTNRAALMRSYDWYDVKPWDKRGYFWGFNITGFARYKTKLLDRLQNRFRIFSYDEKSLHKFSQRVNSCEFIEGYSSMIYETAKIFNKNKLKAKNVKLVKGTSEMILDVYHKESIQAFGTKVVSEYGAAEAGLIAFECPEGNMHINEENVYLETDDNGSLLVTNLVSKSFPIIRYRLGDSVKLGGRSCKCGMKHMILSEIQGRQGATIKGKNNSFPALTIYYIFKNIAQEHDILLNYRSTQEKVGILDLTIEEFNQDTHEPLIKKEAEKYFGNEISININYIEKFPIDNKKSQYFQSMIQE